MSLEADDMVCYMGISLVLLYLWKFCDIKMRAVQMPFAFIIVECYCIIKLDVMRSFGSVCLEGYMVLLNNVVLTYYIIPNIYVPFLIRLILFIILV